MRAFGVKASIGLLAPLVSVATLLAPPAAAARHHRHHHHHRARGGVTCGPSTTDVGGVCTATPPPGPVGNSGVVITPSDVTMTLAGAFAATLTMGGLPPLTPGLTGNAGSLAAACTGPITFLAVGSTVDALGRIEAFIRGSGCVPGTYPLVVTEVVSPFQSFTGFITLHF